MTNIEHIDTRSHPLLTRARKAVEMEEIILDQLVLDYHPDPEDEQAFRLGHRAQWRAVAALQAGIDDVGSVADFVETLRQLTNNPQDTNDAERAAEFAELMRKIAA